MSEVPSVTLHNGVEMPLLGFGVFQIPDLAECEQAVVDALEVGYRLIDTARSYLNEDAVGRAIKRSGVPREELFVTSKLWVHDVSYEGAKSGYQRSLERLGLDHLDLLLIHQPYNDLFGAWRAMEELHREGKVRAIGVSNLTSDRLVDLILYNEVAPMVNQIETHPFNQQLAARKVMDEYHVQHEGWAPFAEGRQNLFTNSRLEGIAERLGKSVAQVVLRWNIQRAVVVIPKSTHKDRIAQNFDIFDFELTAEDMKAIATLDEAKGLFVVHEDPEFVKALHDRELPD
jgi:2,5-diketo-D-gluconate reductase A